MFEKSRICNRLLASFVFITLAVAGLFPPDTAAQVTIRKGSREIIIRNAGFRAQRILRRDPITSFSTSSTTVQSSWSVMDSTGTRFEVATYRDDPDPGDPGPIIGGYEQETYRDDPDPGDPGVLVGGYEQETYRDDPDPGDPGPIIGGYEQALDYLRVTYGAVIERDTLLRADLIMLPRESDPIGRFFEIIVTDTLNGHPLIDYFRLVEVVSRGVFDQPVPSPATPIGRPLPFPNDPYLRNQWNLVATRTLQAQWYTTGARKRVRIGIIDSGIGTAARSRQGLDGTEISYVPVAPTTDRPLSHGLSLVTLLADRANDASGIIGLLGDHWNMAGCDRSAPFFQSAPPEVRVYNVGDFGPISLYVARAIRQAIQDGVDVINLSLAMPESPVVEAAIREALAHNVVVVAAAGNYDAAAVNKPVKFPANIDGVIAVGAADQTLAPTSFSALAGVDLFAPGTEIVTGGEEGLWVTKAGSSLAAPHVTAAVAMLRAARPDLTPAQVQAALLAGARTSTTGTRFLNTFDALARMVPYAGIWSMMPGACLTESARTLYDMSDATPFTGKLLERAEQAPAQTDLKPVFPNPSRTEATVRFDLAEEGSVHLAVYDMLGREVLVLTEGVLAAGTHEVRLEASTLPAGQYLVRMKTQEKVLTRIVRIVR